MDSRLMKNIRSTEGGVGKKFGAKLQKTALETLFYR